MLLILQWIVLMIFATHQGAQLRMNTTIKIFKTSQFILVIIDTARMSMEINTMVLECSSLQLFCGILDKMIHADIWIQISMIPPMFRYI